MESNRRIIEYDVIHVMYLREVHRFCWPGLIIIINKKIEEGWIPLGGISTTISSTNHTTFSQAIVKYDS